MYSLIHVITSCKKSQAQINPSLPTYGEVADVSAVGGADAGTCGVGVASAGAGAGAGATF